MNYKEKKSYGQESLLLEGTYAVAEAVKLCRVKVIAGYPITPSSAIAEKLADMVGNDEIDAKYIKVESEHSSMSSLIGASHVGVRTFTATSSHGLAYMHEVLHWASGARLPIVMSNTNRALGSPWSIFADQTDSLSQRDTGWIQFYCESNQEIFDTIIQAYKIAEKVYLPAMVNMDAFFSTHTLENLMIPSQEMVDSYLPEFEPEIKIDTDNPMAFGGVAPGDTFFEFKYKMEEDMLKVLKVAVEADNEFGEIFGREYGMLECYLCDDAEIVLVITGTAAGTARAAIDKMRSDGKRVGLVRIRLFRPFPSKEIIGILKDKVKIAVIDRNISHGAGGIFAQELKSAFYNTTHHPPIFGFIAGLGGKDITPERIEDVLNYAIENDNSSKETYWLDVDI
ncbi:pyruvate ferredoxin oxidoreductase [candidate division KSB1 bacterium]